MKDAGRIEVVEQCDIRKLSPLFMSVRDGSVKCHLADIKVAGASSVDEFPVWSTLACEHLNELINDHRCNLSISKKVGEFAY